MAIKTKLRLFLFNLIGKKNVDRLRYLKISSKFKWLLRYKKKDSFIREFSNFYEKEMQIIPKILNYNKENVIFDIGANYGPYSFFFSKVYPNSKILAFEPEIRTYNILKKIIKRFHLRNVIPIKKGLGDKEEIREICMPIHYTIIAYVSNKNQVKEKGDLFEKIEITTIDEFIKRNNMSQVDFIKCDVEGFESEVFKGAKNTIKKFKPIVFVEIEERHTKKYGVDSNNVLEFFRDLGYSPYAINKNRLVKVNSVIKEFPLYLLIPGNYDKSKLKSYEISSKKFMPQLKKRV